MLCCPALPRLWLLPLLAALSFPLPAQRVLITGVEGQVLYGPGESPPTQPVCTGQKLGPGTFAAGNDGILFLSAFDGSEVRLSESGTLSYDGDDQICEIEAGGHNLRSNFHLRQGKAQVTVRVPARPPHCYHIIFKRSAASMAQGQCVMCMHGSGTFLLVARGRVAVTEEPPSDPGQSPLPESIRPIPPLYGALPPANGSVTLAATVPRQWLVGDGRVGVIGADGNIRLEPLSALQAGTQTCLLAGFNKEMVSGGGKRDSPDPEVPSRLRHLLASPVVSPTQ